MLPASFQNAVAVTPHDTNPVIGTALNPLLISGIYVGGAGNVTVITAGGQTTLFTAPPVGSTIYVRCTHVKSTGTSATALVALY